MKLSIITPCFNAERFIRETVDSVLSQTAVLSGRCTLEYIVRDGASRDRTLALLAGYGAALTVVSEPDSGMYDALAKGLQSASGDICAYLNAGDYYNPHAFDVVLDVFATHPVRWLTGCTVSYNERSQITRMRTPFIYRRPFFRTGIYTKYLEPVQQESTFWARELLATVDYPTLGRQKLAGDFYLWSRFATVAELVLVESHLGGFRHHAGQLSENMAAYRAEVAALSRRPPPHHYALAVVDRVLSFAPSQLKKRLGPNRFLRFDHQTQRWH